MINGAAALLAAGWPLAASLLAAKTYSIRGFLILAVAAFGILIGATVAEIKLTTIHRKSIGHYINGFVVAYSWMAFLFALVAGAMVSHFFLGLAGHEARDWLCANVPFLHGPCLAVYGS